MFFYNVQIILKNDYIIKVYKNNIFKKINF